MDTKPETGFDDMVLLATQICETPVGLVSLLAADRQWFKANIGFPACETSLDRSVCAHALGQNADIFIIPDLTQDERTCGNPLVTGDPHIRFYAGALLTTPDGTGIGTLCVIDTLPRPAGLTPRQIDSLRALARQVVMQLELRRALVAAAEADAALKQQHQLLIGELQHRLQNLLAMVQAMITQSLRSTVNVAAARDVLVNRIAALSRAQQILFSGKTESVDLVVIVADTVKLYDGGLTRRFVVTGPSIELSAKAALALAMMLHELATNATKYGALSTNDGTVAIKWSIRSEEPEALFELIWQESGGPPVVPPAKNGFGSRLIQRALTGSDISLTYPATGVECVLVMTLSKLRTLR